MMRFLRSAFVVARRDFSATVLSKTFIFFLLAPLFPAAMGGLFGGITTRVAGQAERPVVAVIAPKAQFERLEAARDQLTSAIDDQAMVKIVGFSPERDLAAQQKRLLASQHPPIRAVLSGGLDHPRLVGALGDPVTVGQLKLLTMVMSQLIEEKSNKIIEVIAAAIRIDAMFVGKLFAMLSASILALVV